MDKLKIDAIPIILTRYHLYDKVGREADTLKQTLFHMVTDLMVFRHDTGE